MNDSSPNDLARERRFVQILWAAFLGSLVVYTGVLYVVVASGPPVADPDLLSTIRSIFAVIAVGLALAGFVVRRRLSASVVPGPAAAPADSATAARLRAGCIVAWALSEAVAVLGLVLGILGRQTSEFVPFAVAAAVLLYLHRPAVWPFAATGGSRC